MLFIQSSIIKFTALKKGIILLSLLEQKHPFNGWKNSILYSKNMMVAVPERDYPTFISYWIFVLSAWGRKGIMLKNRYLLRKINITDVHMYIPQRNRADLRSSISEIVRNSKLHKSNSIVLHKSIYSVKMTHEIDISLGSQHN